MVELEEAQLDRLFGNVVVVAGAAAREEEEIDCKVAVEKKEAAVGVEKEREGVVVAAAVKDTKVVESKELA